MTRRFTSHFPQVKRPRRAAVAAAFVLGLLVTARADVLLDVPEIFQQHSQWCWAGTSQATLNYYGQAPTQCAIANWAFSRSDCCGSSDFDWAHDCNYWNYMFGGSARGENPNGSLRGILQHDGVQSTVLDTALTRDAVVDEIDHGRPFIIRFGWTGGGGHFLVGRGYDQAGTYVDYLDPWPGNGHSKALYAWMVSAADHTWSHTLRITTNPPPPPGDLSLSGVVRAAGNVPITGVLLTLGGAGSATTTTDDAGAFRFDDLDAGTYTVTPSLATWVFTPGTRTVVLRRASRTGVSFKGVSTLPDLQVKALVAPPRMTRNATVAVTATVVNRGISGAGPSDLALYWSADAVVGPPDAPAGTCQVGALAPQQVFACRLVVTVPAGLTPGVWHLGGAADAAGAVAEASETNNARSRRVTIR